MGTSKPSESQHWLWVIEASVLLSLQRRLQKGISAVTALRPITRAFKASKQVILLSTLPISLCLLYFSEGLNAEYVKGENMEAVVSEEPQGESLVPLTPACIPPQKTALPRDFLKVPGAARSCCVPLMKAPLRRCCSFCETATTVLLPLYCTQRKAW